MDSDNSLALQRAGRWDSALAATRSPRRRAEILVDRHLWRLDDPAGAVAAVDAVRDAEPALAMLLTGQLGYWRRLFGPPKSGPSTSGPSKNDSADDDPPDDDPVGVFAEILGSRDAEVARWAAFWHAVTSEVLHGDRETAAAGYERARLLAGPAGDLLLESYTARHQGFLRLDQDREAGIALLRRSLTLRAAVGARPHVTAAQQALAGVLGDGPEAAGLLAAATATADELGLTWLRPLLAAPAPAPVQVRNR